MGLQRQADQLDERAWAVYAERTGQEPGPALRPDEDVIGTRLSTTGNGRDRLTGRGGAGSDAQLRASTREDRR